MKYSVVSIQPQIWDNDAIWVWRSLAFPPSQTPPIPQRHFSTASSVAGFYLWEGLLLCWLSSSSSAQKTVNDLFPTLHFFSSSVCYFSCWLALWLTPWLTSTKQYCLSRPPPPHFPSLSLLLLLPPAPLSPPFLILDSCCLSFSYRPLLNMTSTDKFFGCVIILDFVFSWSKFGFILTESNFDLRSIVSFQGSLGQIKTNVLLGQAELGPKRQPYMHAY